MRQFCLEFNPKKKKNNFALSDMWYDMTSLCVKRGNPCGKGQHKMAYSSGEKGTYEIALHLLKINPF